MFFLAVSHSCYRLLGPGQADFKPNATFAGKFYGIASGKCIDEVGIVKECIPARKIVIHPPDGVTGKPGVRELKLNRADVARLDVRPVHILGCKETAIPKDIKADLNPHTVIKIPLSKTTVAGDFVDQYFPVSHNRRAWNVSCACKSATHA